MNIKRFLTNKLLLVIATLLFTSCVSIFEPQESISVKMRDTTPNDSTELPQDRNTDTNSKQDKIVQAALDATKLGYPNTLKINNRSFNNDCSGLIYGIFWSAEIDLLTEISKESGNGVKRLYKVMERNNLLHWNKLPQPGDLVFWSNTYGSWGNNPLSHIGVVVSCDRETGQIEYVHNNTYLGAIRKESMNLYKPHEKRPVNNYMRYDSKYKKTAAELFEAFGMAWAL